MKRFKKFLTILLLFAFVAVFYLSLPRDESGGTRHVNNIDRQLSTYSDQHITDTAKIDDPQFKHLAFAELGTDTYPSTQPAATIRAFKFFLQFLSFKEETQEYGTWLWTPTLVITPEYTQTILNEAERENINTIYLSVDSYLDIFAMPDGVAKERKKGEFEKVLNNFIVEANKRGIEVDAEGGWRNWAEPGHEYKSLAIVSFVKEFNSKNLNKFRGFQYDVEPYMLEGYEQSSSTALSNFIKLVDKTEKSLDPDGLRFSVVIPAFYDKDDGATPLITYRGVETSVFEHLLKILERRNGNSIIVMSYRNFAKKSDGSIEISNNELSTARRGRYNTRIVIAQETGDFLPEYITFHGKSKNYFRNETGLLSKAFVRNPNFGGLAIHFANSMYELK